MADAVKFEGIGKRYNETPVLSDVSFACEAGRVQALVGENGAGKSTLLKILTGSVKPDAGDLYVNGEKIRRDAWNPLRSRASGIAIVHQEFALLPNLSIADNIFLGNEIRKGPRVDTRSQESESRRLLESVGSRLDPHTRVEDLNIADAQLVEIAKALSTEAKILALDEPTAVLSGAELETLFRVIENLKASGVAVIYVSHRMNEIFRLCDDYTVLKDGEVAGRGLIKDTSQDQIVRMMVGRDVANVFPERSRQVGNTVLALENFEIQGLAEPISLEVRAGEVVGVAGLGGSGRSRLLKGIFGLLPSTGQCRLQGEAVYAPKTAQKAIRAGIAYLPEDRKVTGLALDRSVRHNLTLLTLKKILSFGFLNATKEKVLSKNLVEAFGIKTSESGAFAAASLSGGNQQKVVFAKWLAMEPNVLLLDEPTRGIDVAAKEEIYRVIRERAEAGAGVLMVSSELIEILGLTDRILVMADGAIVGELEPGATEEDVMQKITASSLQNSTDSEREMQ